MKKKCRQCQKTFFGRSDKIFCSVTCKNAYHNAKRNHPVVSKIDNSLHRNRTTLEELLNGSDQPRVLIREELENLGFRFEYVTQIEITSNGEFEYVVYDYKWKRVSDQEVMIQKMDV